MEEGERWKWMEEGKKVGVRSRQERTCRCLGTR